MKSPQTVTDDCDDIFGPPRTYEMGYSPPKNRPSMISAKYRQKEERRKVLKISINKLKKIEDPESSLCRSVLINNTMKRLQKEARDEKIQKQQLNYPRCYDNDNFLNLKSEFIKNELKTPYDCPQDFVPNVANIVESVNTHFAIDDMLDNKPSDSNQVNSSNNLVIDLSDCNLENGFGSAQQEANSSAFSRKRSFEDDMEYCDVQDVLSQLYMPPTPRLLTCIDDDEDLNVVDDDEPVAKRAKIEETNSAVVSAASDSAEDDNSMDDEWPRAAENIGKLLGKETCTIPYTNNNLPETADSRLRYVPSSQPMEVDTNAFSSCGHASLFNEIQNHVYQSLLTSMET